jgi:hypothetical protein
MLSLYTLQLHFQRVALLKFANKKVYIYLFLAQLTHYKIGRTDQLFFSALSVLKIRHIQYKRIKRPGQPAISIRQVTVRPVSVVWRLPSFHLTSQPSCLVCNLHFVLHCGQRRKRRRLDRPINLIPIQDERVIPKLCISPQLIALHFLVEAFFLKVQVNESRFMNFL